MQRLVATLRDRYEHRPAESYSATLFNSGRAAIARKVGEEATEVILAAVGGEGRERIISESADLVFHLVALLVSEGIDWTEIEAELARRR
jgi:phosphoribosyl-ATP pyrophosphohydrolase